MMLAAEGGFVKLRDRVEGGDVGNGAKGGDIGGRAWWGFGIESLERVRVRMISGKSENLRGKTKITEGNFGVGNLKVYTKWHYNSHIAAFFTIVAIASMQNGVFIAAGFRSAAISTLPPLKHIYGGSFMFHHYRTLQKTIAVAAVPENAAIGNI